MTILVLDSYFGIHAQALALRAQRMELLSSNLANADTPHYKARDVDFRQALSRATPARMTLARTHPAHLAGPAARSAGVEPRYRVPMQPAVDGNTVDPELELTAFAENAMQYQTTLRFLNGRIASLKAAITGGE